MKMKFNVNQQDLQKSLNYCQGVIEKRSTLPILSNVLLGVSNSELTITATDVDLIFIHKINNDLPEHIQDVISNMVSGSYHGEITDEFIDISLHQLGDMVKIIELKYIDFLEKENTKKK